MKHKHQFMKAVQILAPNDQGVAPQVFTGLNLHQKRRGCQLKTLTIQDSLQIKAAEYWLKLGEADQALEELEGLPARSWIHGWALKTRIAAIGVLRERSEATVQN